MIILIAILVIVKTVFIEPTYPAWAHSHWVWINGPNQNQTNLLEMIGKYQENGIEIGALLVDSAWSTQFNNFKWNNTKFPDPKGMIDYLHSEGIRVIAWVTSIINNGSSNYQYAKQKGYFLNNGSIIQWWHGNGSYLDYRNKQGVDWWHKQMDQVLDMGLDGWKTDRCDLFLNRLKPWPYSQKISNIVGMRQYSNSYYRDFFYYTRTKNEKALIMARPVDRQHGQTIYRQFAPKDVVFSGWVGDQHSSYEGLQQALKNVFLSAWKGYLNFGFDIGGYSGQNFSKNGFIRFAQTGALLPLMQNGGHGRHCPWQFDSETVQIYSKYVKLHLDLMPYFLTAGSQALLEKVSVILPLAKKQGKVAPLNPSNFGYLFWKDILVHSIFNDQGIVNITFPKDSNWVYYFNHQKVFRDKSTTLVQLDLDQSPIFLRMGATIPFATKYILVYPSLPNYSRTILSQNYTDYISYSKTQTSFSIKIQRYYKQNYLSKDSQTTIQIIGAIKYLVDEKYSPKFKHNTLIFNLPFNITLSIDQLVIGNSNEEKNEKLLTQ